MPKFTDEEIYAIFGADAAEDEEPDRLKSFFFKNKSYQSIRANLPLRILVGHKGIGKSALLRMSYFQDQENDQLALWLKPNDLRVSDATGKSIIDKIELYKERILKLVFEKSLDELEISAIDAPEFFNSAKRILSGLHRKAMEYAGTDANEEINRLRRQFSKDKKVNIYIDDIDRGWSATKDDIGNISALMNAARDLSNEDRNLQFRIGLRTDAYFLYRTSDESTDKIEGNVIRLTWSNHDILVVMAVRVASYNGEKITSDDIEKMKQTEVASLLHPIIDSRFQVGKGHWDNAPIHIVLLSLTRKRPRDLIKLLSGAAREAYRNDHDIISSSDLERTFENYSNERMNDIVLEFNSEVPNVERLLYNMRPTTSKQKEKKKNFLYSNDELLRKIRNILQNHDIRFANGKPATPHSLAEFLYKIDFLIARSEDDAGRPSWTYFDQNRMLQSQFVDFGYQWEVHPAYRWALNPKGVQRILDELDY